MQVSKSNKLANVCYDIRGPVLKHAKRLEEEGHRILKLNIGNPAPFGFEAPEEILQDVIRNLPTAQGYSDSKGLFSARKAVMQYYQQKQVEGVGIEDIYLGNGVSELIVMSMQALLNNGDEVLIPAPDYPLWTAAVSLAGGKAVHYLCDEQANWWPDLEDIKAKITPNTRAMVIINPNNPTGAVYSREVLEGMVELARQHNLVLFSDEIYDKILYDGAVHVSTASLAPDVLCLTFNGLSKSYRVAGFRSGWVAISGPKQRAQSYIEGLDILANMRLCANVPAQHAIQTALGGYQSINDLVLPPGRLLEQRNRAKKDLLYKTIDASDFYTNPIQPSARSWMNVPFRLADERLDKPFLEGAEARGLLNLKGHRSVGGMRASIYNALGLDAVEALVAYMAEFEKEHG
ncbi:aminotransferase class I/II-fold pyridoxal phosphate-dependent enzyme [Pseudomonas aeruginosa]|uniref:aminotransferase class I/II-fold pyridoxal phosphate-dependent enzyme n=3 Tax=Gammaproteobacteria TaxID=1236 RepID=UPI0009A4F78B|nr:aminotransferase class I/II-fold pyridoxal phosphate-dependent enzyme [Pseudomonas aeruginosa]